MKQLLALALILGTGCTSTAGAEQPVAVPVEKVIEKPLMQLAQATESESLWLKDKPNPVPQNISKAALNDIEAYFNRITTMESQFVQVAPDGQVTEGKFYLSRPGKVRWEYFPPASVVIVGKSGLITYYDKGLDQISHTSLDSTPVSFLTRENIRLEGGDLQVKSIKETSASYELTLTQTDKEVEGRVVLTFSKSPLELKRIEVIDAAEQQTRITFTESKFGHPIGGELFIIKNPRLFKKW